MMTMKARVRQDNVRAESVMTDQPDHAREDNWQANWYRVTLKRKRRTMTVVYGMGMAHTDEPTAVDVLGSLCMDAASVENAASFEDWAADFGYDPDSRKAERTFRACEEQTAQLKQFLGDAYAAYLWETEQP